MPQLRFAFTLLVAIVLAIPASASDWPQFRGPGGQGVSPDKGLPAIWSEKENVVWKAELPGPGTSSPVIIGDKVYLTSHTGYRGPRTADKLDDLRRHLVCLNRVDGKLIWTREIKPKLPEQPTIREEHGYASSTPAADAERVYCFFGVTGVIAFDHAGTERWRADVGSRLNGWGSAASPVLFEETVIVNASVESNSVVALDRKTGKEVWRTDGVRDCWHPPVIVPVEGRKSELIIGVTGQLLGFDPASGKKLWTCATEIPWYMVPIPVFHDGVIYAIGGRPGGALAVRTGGRGDVTKTHLLWTAIKGSNVSSPVYHDGHLYWMHDNQGIAFCAEAKSGKIVYEKKIDRAGQVYASPVLADGKLYYTSRTGRTYVIAAKPEFEQLAVNEPLDRGTFNASPAVADGRLYLRTDRFLYCIGK